MPLQPRTATYVPGSHVQKCEPVKVKSSDGVRFSFFLASIASILIVFWAIQSPKNAKSRMASDKIIHLVLVRALYDKQSADYKDAECINSSAVKRLKYLIVINRINVIVN